MQKFLQNELSGEVLKNDTDMLHLGLLIDRKVRNLLREVDERMGALVRERSWERKINSHLPISIAILTKICAKTIDSGEKKSCVKNTCEKGPQNRDCDPAFRQHRPPFLTEKLLDGLLLLRFADLIRLEHDEHLVRRSAQNVTRLQLR